MKPPYTDPRRLALNAMRMITGRVAKGYWPYAYVAQMYKDAQWTVFVTVKQHSPKKPSDKEAYTFEFWAADEKTAREAVDLLHQKFYGEKEN